MAMMTREPGFLGMAKRKAQKQGMLTIPKRWTPQGGGEEYPAFINQQEMALLKQQGGQGFMTPYGIPSFDKDTSGYGEDEGASAAQSGETGQSVSSDPGATFDWGSIDSNDSPDALDIPTPKVEPKKPEYSIGYDKSKNLWENIMSINIPGWIEQEWDKLDFSGKPKGDLTPQQKLDALKNNPEAQTQVMSNLGGPEAESAANDAVKSEAYEKDRAEDYAKNEELQKKRTGYTEGVMTDASGKTEGQEGYDPSTATMQGGYEGYKGEVKELGTKSKDLTEGTMQDDQGRTPDDPNYDKTTGKMRGGLAGDVGKLDQYAPKFDTLADEAGVRGKEGSEYFQGVMTDASGLTEGQEGYDPSTATRKGGAAERYTTAADTGVKRLDDLSAGVMTDASGKKEGEEGYDASTATMKGGYDQVTGEDISKATTAGSKTARDLASGVMTDASGKTEGQEGYDASSATMKGGYKQITGQDTVDAAAKGSKGFIEGALGVMTDASGKTEGQEGYDASSATMKGGVQEVGEQFGKEGFQKEAGDYQSQLADMSDKALSGDVGQREAGMLKGRMEEGRMASQKGSEEKLRREMAQSGASPAEIASKVAQFQRQSAAQQQQAGRSEILDSQLQGQKLGQGQLTQAAGLTEKALGALGEKAGMAETRAGLDVTKAELRGKGAAMEMEGSEAQTAARLAALKGMSGENVTATGMDVTGAEAIQDYGLKSLAGKTDIAETSTGLSMEGVKGAGDLTKTGLDVATDAATQEANMLGEGVSAITASGDAKVKQMGGIDQQVDIVGEQGEYTQAQLDDIIAQQTAAATKESGRLTRAAQGTPDDPYYRPPEETPVVESAVDTVTGLPTGTTIAPGQTEDLPIQGKAEGGPVQGGRPYIVGEKGRELFTPSQSGKITPNNQLPPAPAPMNIEQTGEHSFTVAQGDAPVPASKGGVNAPPPPQPQVAPPMGGLSPLQQGGMMGGKELSPMRGMGTSGDQDAFNNQQGGKGQLLGLPPQGNNPQTLGQQGGLMGQPLSPEQKQVMDLQNKKRRQMGMQSYQMR